MIPDEVIEEIKRRTDIGAVIGRSVKLKRQGKNLVGLCPFHSEKTPSFNVHPDDGYYYCFGCKETGDVVRFVEKTTGQHFLDVVRTLAAEAGVEIPEEDVDPAERERRAEKKKLGRVLDLAQVFFRQRLIADSGKAARAYLKDVRKLDDDEIERFGLGFGGANDATFEALLTSEGASVDDGVRAGVLGKSDRGPYDFYRHRITIPIRGRGGEILAFGGRAFGEQQQGRPKYVNGPTTSVYDKSAVLYGMYEALPALKQGRPAILVEGYLDVMALHKVGLPCAVAPCGTSLTPRHVEELVQKAKRVVVCMDADSAGQAASERALLMLLRANVDVGLVLLPDKDPDAMARAGQGPHLKTLCDGAPAALDAVIARALEGQTGSVAARLAAVDQILPFLAAPGRELVRAGAMRAAAKALGEDERVLEGEVQKRGVKLLGQKLRLPGSPGARGAPASSSSSAAARPAAPTGPAASAANADQADPRPDDEAHPQAPRRPRAPPVEWKDAEKSLARDLLLYPHLAPRCGVLVDVLRNRELKRFIARLVDALVHRHAEDPRVVLQQVGVPRGEMSAVATDIHRRGGFTDPGAVTSEESAIREIDGMIITVDRRVLEHRLGEVQPAIAAADQRSDHGERKRLLQEQAVLVKALQELDGHLREDVKPLARPVAKVVLALVPPGPPDEAAAPPDEGGGGDDDEDDAPVRAPGPPRPGDAGWTTDPDDDPWG